MGMQGLTAKGAPVQPKFLLYLKIAILVLSLVILALAAYSISLFAGAYGYYGGTGVGGLLIFVVIKTFIIYGVFLFLEMKSPHLFYRIVAVILYAFSIIFWLSAWAWSASVASLWLSVYGSYDYYGYNSGYYSYGKNEGAALAACAGLGAVVWILSIVHFVFFIRACMRDGATTTTTHNQAELGHMPPHKTEASSTVHTSGSPAPVYNQQQPGAYQQQPGAYQQQTGPYQQPPATYQQPHQTYNA